MLLREKPWDKNLQLLLASIVGFNVLPHIWTVPIWVTVMALCCVAWKFLYLTRGVQFPKRWILWSAAVLATAGIAATYYNSFSQETSSALLVIMASLKLLETNRYRDAMLVIFTSYFLLMSYLLESQSLPTTVFMVVDVFLITALMYQVHRRDGKSGPRSFRPVLRQLALLVPMWIFLFIAFPRFSTGLWNLRAPQNGTGFSDELNPGAINRLVDSDEIAFRADFKDGNLSPASLYWRGAILTEGHGLKWTKSKIPFAPDLMLSASEEKNPATRIVSYEVFLEPGMGNWLFAIDVPNSISSSDSLFLQQIRKRPGFIYQTVRPVVSRVAYRLTSRLSPPTQVLSHSNQLQTLRIPENLSPKIKELAKALYAAAQTDPRYTQFKTPEEKALHETMLWFADRKFRYSKTPGALLSNDGAEQLEEFLFKTKVGFCEHYSAAFATLMRAMGIPARVVVGFQGGSHNEFGDYYLVRKMDAHAWAEIWIGDSGSPSLKESHGRWQRVDPTETIAPLRLQLGGEFYRMDPNTFSLGTTGEAIRQRLHKGIAGFIRKSQAAWDALQMQWNAFLLLYDLDFQMQLLARLGITDAAPYLLLVILATGAVLFAGAMNWTLRRRAQRKDPVLEEWRYFCRALERRGIQRQPNEGPMAFAQRASAVLPKAETQIRQVANVFANLRYGSSPKTSPDTRPDTWPDTPPTASPSTKHLSTTYSIKKFRQLVRQSLRELSSSESSRVRTS